MTVINDVTNPFGRPVHQFRHPNSDAQKTLFKFPFFNCVSIKEYVEVVITDFTMHLIMSKWLRAKKWTEKKMKP